MRSKCKGKVKCISLSTPSANVELCRVAIPERPAEGGLRKSCIPFNSLKESTQKL